MVEQVLVSVHEENGAMKAIHLFFQRREERLKNLPVRITRRLQPHVGVKSIWGIAQGGEGEGSGRVRPGRWQASGPQVHDEQGEDGSARKN